MIPRYGERVRTGVRYRLRPGAYAILPFRSDVLLTIQTSDEDDLQLPGGGLDPGESPLQALHREVLEETGWRIAAPRHLGTFRRFVYMPEYGFWAEKLCQIFVARPVAKIAEPVETDHVTVLMPLEQAVKQLGNEGDSAMLLRYVSTLPENSKRMPEISSGKFWSPANSDKRQIRLSKNA